MPRMEVLPEEDLEEFAGMFANLEGFFGFIPNDFLTMARRPQMLKGLAALTVALTSDGAAIPRELQFMIPYLSSLSAGCMYCTAHAAKLCEDNGVSLEKIQNIWDYDTHPLFTEQERVALRVVDRARRIPNQVTVEDFAALKEVFNEVQVTEIIGLTAMMGFYNVWNETVATVLEGPPREMAACKLESVGWKIGKHAEETNRKPARTKS